MCLCKYFLPGHSLSNHSLDIILAEQTCLIVMKSGLSIPSFMGHILEECSILKLCFPSETSSLVVHRPACCVIELKERACAVNRAGLKTLNRVPGSSPSVPGENQDRLLGDSHLRTVPCGVVQGHSKRDCPKAAGERVLTKATADRPSRTCEQSQGSTSPPK